MSARTAAPRSSTAAQKRQAVARRRRFGWLLGAALATVAAIVVLTPVDKVVKEFQLPLQHEDIIRQQAADKDLDPALIAAVIYTESRFQDQTSSAGAQGLMQLLPSTAHYIANLSGGTAFEDGDLATPQINIAYGSYYLHYLLEKYRGSEVLALAAYNAGEGKVDEWLAGAAATGETFRVAKHIPFAETREYVTNVLNARAEYRKQYAHELGL
ncbi:MAG: soluble lytic murein transglycosylase [Solirubrobacteraceae bacterium]|jgi:soluble lytic murein transglycosylase|nr:soluble lytic murein transglycosylase [Solirubrobacteraceae bacterium]